MPTSSPRTTLATVTTPAGRALATPPAVALMAVVPSGTRQGRQHAIMRASVAGEVVYGCTCEAGTFRPDRECVHVREFRAGTLREGTVLTPEGHVVQRAEDEARTGSPAPAPVQEESAAVDPAHAEMGTIRGSDTTFRIRHRLAQLGCSWDRDRSVWLVPSSVRGTALTLIAQEDRRAVSARA
jgi:hypothetical protein